MRGRAALLIAAVMAWGCADAPTAASPGITSPATDAATPRQEFMSTRWNARATALLQEHAAPSNGQAWASRMLTYLSIAQYRAALAATSPEIRGPRPSVTAAVARASATVLGDFFTWKEGLPATVEGLYLADRDRAEQLGEPTRGRAAGEAIGHAVAAAVLAQAAADGYLSLAAPTPPTGAGMWVPNGAMVRSVWGATPFFLDAEAVYGVDPGAIAFVPPPPAFGSPAFMAAVDRVRGITGTSTEAGTRTPDQLEIALAWNKSPPAGPYTAGDWNHIASELIEANISRELRAARILAYANAASFDAQIACFAAKFAYWVPRPSHVDPTLAVAFPPPNHPSYPSAHSCISGAFAAVLSRMVPPERPRLDALVAEAGWSRVYAGIHYPFDVEAGQHIGRVAARAALAGSLE